MSYVFYACKNKTLTLSTVSKYNALMYSAFDICKGPSQIDVGRKLDVNLGQLRHIFEVQNYFPLFLKSSFKFGCPKRALNILKNLLKFVGVLYIIVFLIRN